MARECARVKMGYYPTQEGIVPLIAEKFCFVESDGCRIPILDAGCGTGAALKEFSDCLKTKDQGRHQFKLFGIELDKERARLATDILKGPSNNVLWSPMEDATVDGRLSVLYFNPVYDRIRGQGRTELDQFERVKEWPARSKGLLILIVPDYVLREKSMELAVYVERSYDVIGVWKYPEKEYKDFKQCVLIGRRRERALTQSAVKFPTWATGEWPVLTEKPLNLIPVYGTNTEVTLRRTNLTDEFLSETVQASALRGTLLREATALAPKIGRPLLPLTAGHLALALAGGLCDGIIRPPDEAPFLVKGTTQSRIRKTKTMEKTNADGEVTADVEVYRTNYDMRVRCLTQHGSIEEYNSDPGDEEIVVEAQPAATSAGEDEEF